MGIIENGSISGVLPSDKKAFVVHYPGYPSSIERAIETLGGSEGITKVRTDKSGKLELHFRPKDPYSHPTFGKLQSCSNFLLKFSRKKIKDVINTKDLNSVFEQASANTTHLRQNNTFSKLSETLEQIVQPESESLKASSEVDILIQTESQEALFADIVLRVSDAYHFNGMVDYQHVLPIHADITRRKKRKWDEVEPHHEKVGLLDVDHDDLMMLVPPLFSLKDLPETIILKPTADPCLKKKPEADVQRHWEMEMEQCLAIDFNIKDIPKKVNWEKIIPRNSDRWKWQMVVCELFDQRPIWVKESLMEHLIDVGLNVGGNIFRRLLFIAAYYFSYGPFRRFWIKKGYDPREDPESRIYQRVDFRVPPSLRSYCDANMMSGLKNRWADICAFQVFPYKSQVSLQLFELKDDYIQQEISKPSIQENCSLQSGWFSSHVINCLRLRVAQRFLSVYPEAGAESILKLVSNRFERSKRLHIALKDSKVDEEKQANEGIDQTEDKEPEDEVEYDDDAEDEMEDENVGEYLDTDEALNLVDQDRDFSPQPHSYMELENISKGYLQELFCSFPLSGAGGDEMQEDDPDNGEYQIYEQNSDNDYSDDEEY